MKKTLTALSLITLLAGCNNPVEQRPTLEQNKATNELAPETLKSKQALKAQKAAEQLNALFDKAFKDKLETSPVSATYIGLSEYNDKFSKPISKASIKDQLDREKAYLKTLEQIDRSLLSGQDVLSYDIFKRETKLAIKGYEFNSHYLPLNQMYGVHNSFAGLGSGQSAQPFNTVKDYQNFIKRAHGFAKYMDSIIVAMREGVANGYVLPTALIEKVIPQLEPHIVDDASQSIFYGPVAKLADNQEISDSDKAIIKGEYITLINDTLTPAYAKLHKFIKEEYLPNGRASVGLSELPNGKAWYDYQIERNTTLELSAKEIHEFGLAEVARILGEMKKVKQEVKFDGNLTAFFEFLRTDPQFYWETEEEVIAAYTDIKHKIDARLPQLFEVFPKTNYQVKAVEPYRAASSAGASYQSGSPDGSRPGIFYINTYNLKAQPKFTLETLSIHEASPGHHFQISIQQEVQGLPKFRQFGGYTVFAEGWALYAESLGKEMGLFTDPYQWYGRLSDEQLRAMRLVVDTGLHAFGWTREQAIQYMVDNSSLALTDITSEVERYIGIPGQALSYKVGQRAIREMRTKAEQQLGEKFDVRKFHTQVLIDGALPMPILSDKIQRWANEQT